MSIPNRFPPRLAARGDRSRPGARRSSHDAHAKFFRHPGRAGFRERLRGRARRPLRPEHRGRRTRMRSVSTPSKDFAGAELKKREACFVTRCSAGRRKVIARYDDSRLLSESIIWARKRSSLVAALLPELSIKLLHGFEGGDHRGRECVGRS
jgi:hypothetical protein